MALPTANQTSKLPLPPRGLEGTLIRTRGESFVLLSFPISPLPLPGILTRSERAVVALVLEGKRTADIAKAIGVRPRTIANQLQNAYRKLGVASRAALAALVHRVGP